MNRDNTYLHGNKFAVGSGPNRTSFKKGTPPWNKGRKGIHLSRATEFKKGCSSINWLAPGTITVRTDKNGKDRHFIKIANPRKWEELAKNRWKNKYGKLIPADVVHHLNGKSLDDRIENLIALPRKDHPIYHNRWGFKRPTKNQIKFYLARYRTSAASA